MSQEIDGKNELPVYELFLKEVENSAEPVVSIRAPEVRAKANGSGFKVTLNLQDIANKLDSLQPDVTKFQDFYKEARDFYDVKVVLDLKTWGPGGDRFPQLDREVSLRKITLSLDEPDHIVSFDGIVSSFTATIIGQRTLFKCFDSATCVENGSIERTIHFDWSLTRAGSSLIQTHEPLLEAGQGEILIEKRIQNEIDTGTFLVKLRDGDALRQLGLESFLNRYQETVNTQRFIQLNAYGSADQYSENFLGVTAPLEYHGSVEVPASRTPSWIAHIFPQDNALKVRVERLPHYICAYTAVYGDNNQMRLTMPTGQPCPKVPFYSFQFATGGQDNSVVREWLFHF